MMKICASIGSVSEISNVGNANLIEFRMGNIFKELPKNIDRPIIVRARSNELISKYAKEDFDGYLDIGSATRPHTDHKIIASHHDSIRTGTSKEIADRLNSFDCDVAKGVYTINRPSDLMSLYDASKNIKKKHILLGSGEMGVVTRLRPNILQNEFTYAHTGTPTAPGQMSTEELEKASDDSLIVGVLGHPLNKSLSKALFTSVFKELDLNAFYLNFDTVTIENFDDVIRTYEIKGLNVTMPFKNEISALMDSLDHSAEATGSVNTVLNSGSKLIGSNTDVDGFFSAFERSDIDVNGLKVLVIGMGGVARAGALACLTKGANVNIIGSSSKTVKEISKRMGCEYTFEKDPSGYDVIINCSPIGLYTDYGYPIDIDAISQEQTLLDISYSRGSKIEDAARSKGCTVIPGIDVLLGGAMRSFEIWTGKTSDYDLFRRQII